MYTYMYLSRSQYDTKVEYGLVFPRCAETTQWSEELQVKMVQTSNWSTSWAEVFHVGCRLLSNGRCACFEMFSTKLDHSIHLVQRILQTPWPSSLHHVCRFWCGATNKRPSCSVGRSSFCPMPPGDSGRKVISQQMGGSKVFDSPWLGISINGATPKWFIRENPKLKWMITRGTPFMETSIWMSLKMLCKKT